MSNKIKTILLEDDIIEIFYNSNLTKKPYLIRLMNYNNDPYEIRANKEDIEEISLILNQLIQNDSSFDIDNADSL
jgi:hypothetical protein